MAGHRAPSWADSFPKYWVTQSPQQIGADTNPAHYAGIEGPIVNTWDLDNNGGHVESPVQIIDFPSNALGTPDGTAEGLWARIVKRFGTPGGPG